ncbi:putative leucine-rich repeat-containing protein DDB_G0290503 [Macrobrachium rosenbergii]|uniref:putative leucine-rich repeat-containing protein DDB_G0290503 n=1 Tax=Macrobrachium rosenbergii TaxID=79674 RepID=UPI0034D770EC
MQTAQQQILSRHKRDVDQKANERQIQQQATIQDLLYQDATKQATIDQQKKDNLELEEKLRKAQRALLDYQDEQKGKIKKLEDLEVTNRQTISSLMKEIDQLTKRIKDNTQTQQNAMLENRVKELEREAETKERALENLTANNHHLKAKFDQETDQLNFLNNRVAELQAMLTSKTVNIEVLEKDNKVFTDKLRRMESRQGEQNALETRIVDLEAETEAKRMTISALAAENKNLASRLEETGRAGSYAKQLEKELQEIRDQDQANKQTIASLKKDVEKLTRQLNDTQNNLVVSKNKLHDFDSSLRSTEEGYKQTIRSLEQKASRLQQDLHECRIDVKTHQTKLMRAENQLMEAEKLKGNKAALEKKVVKLTQELQECKQNASKPMSEDERQKAISSLNSIIGIKDTKISVLEKKLEEKENQLIESQRALEQQDLDFSTWQDNERRDHNQRIAELTRRLEEATKKT